MTVLARRWRTCDPPSSGTRWTPPRSAGSARRACPGSPPLLALAVVGEQLGRPDLRVEGDVVLAHEVVRPGLASSCHQRCQASGGLAVAVAAGPLDRRRQVPDDRVEPDVELLVRVVLPAVAAAPGCPSRCRGSSPAAGGRRAGSARTCSTLGRQSVRVCSHSPSASASAGRSRKKCSVSTNFGVSPLIRLRGLIRSTGSSWLPQLSHWSPRAPSYPQIGQVPSM